MLLRNTLEENFAVLELGHSVCHQEGLKVGSLQFLQLDASGTSCQHVARHGAQPSSGKSCGMTKTGPGLLGDS